MTKPGDVLANTQASMISILIITKNEENDLPGCLESVAWSDDVHVFDSYSTDGTATVARNRGVKFSQRRFDTYSRHRNAALDTLPFRYPWIFILDADERPTKELAAEMQRVVSCAPDSVSGFRIRRRDFYQGKWLKHAQLLPFYLRLVKNGKAHYTREVNEVLEVDGEIRHLSFPLDHFPFSKGVAHWLDKHNTYSSMEVDLITFRVSRPLVYLRDAICRKESYARHAARKDLFYCMPGRPMIMWCYLMFVRGAILDGRAGISYANLRTIYEYMIVLKMRETQSKTLLMAMSSNPSRENNPDSRRSEGQSR